MATKRALLAALLTTALLAFGPSASARVKAASPHGRTIGSSLVRCTVLHQPGSAHRRSGAHTTVRYFAPTSQAVFFAHSGDRCLWRPGAPARG